MSFLSDYEKFVGRTATVRNEAYAGLGLTGEAGETFDEVLLLRAACAANEANKKIIRNKERPDIGSVDTTNLKSELGDVIWYVTRIATQYGLSLKEIIEYNQEKLLDRKSNGKKTG